MSIDENISNAVKVLLNTYDGIQKLMDDCKRLADGNGYVNCIDKFLRWKSDNNVAGWLLSDFIIIFQKEEDALCDNPNDWRNGPIYSVEINLCDNSSENSESSIILAKYVYEDINSWSKGCSPASHWAFYHPIHNEINKFTQTNGNNIWRSRPNDCKTAKNYWGLKEVVFTKMPLSSVTSSNVETAIFGNFNALI